MVRPGDTLTAIAGRSHRRVGQFVGWNHVANPNVIGVGERLVVPPARYHDRFYRAARWAPRPPVRRSAGVAVRSGVPVASAPSGGGAAVVSSGGWPAPWSCISHFESGGNPAEDTGNGYYGGLQFLPSTWDTAVTGAGLGGYANGRADLAPLGVQVAAADWLAAHAGYGQWSTAGLCGL